MNNNFVKFKKRATITATNNDKYLLEKNRFFIMPHRGIKRYKHKYGNACTITKIDPITGEFNLKDVSFITDVYSFDNKRLRFLQSTYKNVKMFDTEMHDNGKELPIKVIETSDGLVQSISSIEVKKMETDLEVDVKKDSLTIITIDPRIKKLLLIPKEMIERGRKKDL